MTDDIADPLPEAAATLAEIEPGDAADRRIAHAAALAQVSQAMALQRIAAALENPLTDDDPWEAAERDLQAPTRRGGRIAGEAAALRGRRKQ